MEAFNDWGRHFDRADRQPAMKVQGEAWIGNEDSDEYWAEGARCYVATEERGSD